MQKFYLLLLMAVYTKFSVGQQLYTDFENSDFISFLYQDGNLDSSSANPDITSGNNSSYCGMYVRDTNFYDVIVAGLNYKCIDISPYLGNNFNTPKISMKFFSTAPVGTYLLLQLGTTSSSQYPQGIHSEFFAVSNSHNTWETLSFSYLQTTPGATISSSDIDKIVLLIAPGTNQSDTFYIDDLIGPTLLNTLHGSDETSMTIKKLDLVRCDPSPAKEITFLKFNLPYPGLLEIETVDILGNRVYNSQQQFKASGSHSQELDLRNLNGGIYFVKIHMNGEYDTIKLIVDK